MEKPFLHRAWKPALCGALALSAINACGSEVSNNGVQDSVKNTPAVPAPTDAIHKFDQVYEFEGSQWPVTCYYDPSQKVRAKGGDTLLKMTMAHTDLIQPANLERHNIPNEVIVHAVADINHVPDPNKIMADHDYILPKSCLPQ